MQTPMQDHIITIRGRRPARPATAAAAQPIQVCPPGPVTGKDGSQRWYREGRLHREDGPAFVCANGAEYWYLHGRKHREGGPAVVYPSGQKEWWSHGHMQQLELPDQSRYWYKEGRRHREDGPAVEHTCGKRAFYLEGRPCPETDFVVPTLKA